MADIQTLTKEKIKLDEPGMYDVTQKIHQDGQGIVGSYVHEVAEQKGIETTLAARQENFPLQVKVKKQ